MGVRFLQFSQDYPHYFEFLFYSKFERHVQLGTDIQIDYNDENNSSIYLKKL